MSGSAAPETNTKAGRKREVKRCTLSPLWFIAHYVQIEDVQQARGWIPFDLWPAQADVLRELINSQKTIVLKARQLGMTWLMLAYALWLMLYQAQATVLLFSRRDDEAKELLRRLKGMYDHLPPWMRDLARKTRQGPRVITDNEHVFEMGNGSVARAFPSTAGDSYTATFVLIDEADLVPDLGALMASVKPTVDAGGKLALVSRADKRKPNSEFKAVFRGAMQRLNTYAAVFLPWYVRPGRDQAWYEEQKNESLTRTGGLDYVWEQYPASVEEALAPRQKDKRLPAAWLLQCYEPRSPMPLDRVPPGPPLVPELEVYALPDPGESYVLGVDTAEGNPNSDDSAVTVMHADTGAEVAALAGKFEPATLAAHADALATWYNRAPILVERNNHGHAVLLWLRLNSTNRRLTGFDKKPGWLTNGRGKALMYDDIAADLRGQGVTVHSMGTYTQLSSIEGASLEAPEGDLDDRAVSFCLANEARALAVAQKAKPGKGPAKMAGYRG